MSSQSAHTPVLLEETLRFLAPQPGETVLDVTLGLGGHAAAFLEAIGSTGALIGIDADAGNLRHAEQRLRELSGSVQCIHANFLQLPELALSPVDILFADLGLSSPHIDDPTRGFSFRADAPLDLRYDRSGGSTAAELIAGTDERALARIFQVYGELDRALQLAKKAKEREAATTFALKQCAEEVYGYRAPSKLPQVFQALRIAVNHEVDAVTILLETGPRLLKSGGRMGIITYHSLEDRPVKQVFRSLCTPEKDEWTGAVSKPAEFALLTKKPVLPGEEEQRANPRSRSAKLRAIRRTQSSL